MKKLLFIVLLLAVGGVGFLVRHFTIREPNWDAYLPDIGKLYNRSAQFDDPTRNPVILIPGLLGTQLQQENSDTIVWGAFNSDTPDPSEAEDARLFALPIDGKSSVSQLQDDVNPTNVIKSFEIKISGYHTTHRAYINILRMLGIGGYRDEDLGLSGAVDYGDNHFTCFQFPYDWRKDNVANAQLFHQFILEKKAYVENERKALYGENAKPVKFDIVTHSMGGLIGRYYLRYGNQPLENATLNWSGSEFVERFIMIGTPNLGSVKSVMSMSEGFQYSQLLPRYPGATLATFPSIYQTMPREWQESVVDAEGKPASIFDAKQWKENEWGFFNPADSEVLSYLLPSIADEKRREEIAYSFLESNLERAQLFHQALDQKAQPPEGLEMYLFAGDNTETYSKIKSIPVDLRTKNQVFDIVETLPGDDTVTRVSAVADMRVESDWTRTVETPITFDGIYFLFSDHFGITRNPVFIDNSLYLLLEKGR